MELNAKQLLMQSRAFELPPLNYCPPRPKTTVVTEGTRNNNRPIVESKATQTGICTSSKFDVFLASHNQRKMQLNNGIPVTVNSQRLSSKVRNMQRRRSQLLKARTTLSYLQGFFCFLYYVGISPLKPKSAVKLPQSYCHAQKVLLWVVAATSILQSLDDVKLTWIQFRLNEHVLHFMYFGFFTVTCVTRIYYIKVLIQGANSAQELFQKIDKIDSKHDTGSAKNRAKKYALSIAMLSLFLTLANVLFGDLSYTNWTLNHIALSRSFDMSESLFVWTSENWRNVTDGLNEKYGKGLNTVTIMLSVASCFFKYCGTLHRCMLLDLWTIFVIEMYRLQHNFLKRLRRSKLNGTTGTCPLLVRWKDFMEIRDIFDHAHFIFGDLLKLIHVQNMLLFGYFLVQVLNKEKMSAYYVLNMTNVLKVAVTYYLAQKLAKMNQNYEDCIIDCSDPKTTIDINGKELNVLVLVADIRRHPIGIGTEEFYVNEAFMIKFGGAVGSLFFLLSGQGDKL